MREQGEQREQAYAAEFAIDMIFPPSTAARRYLVSSGWPMRVGLHGCALYLHHVQAQDWFGEAFPNWTAPVRVLGGPGGGFCRRNTRDAPLNTPGAWEIKIGTAFRKQTSQCEWTCLHELAHLVGGDKDGHDHAWRVNYVRLVRGMLGYRAARYLRRGFEQRGLPTHV